MNKKLETNISKLMSLVLRHKPEVLELSLDSNGWVLFDTLVAKIQTLHKVEKSDILRLIETNNKKRFELDSTGTKIRAVQGHTLDVDVELEEVDLKEDLILFHGTPSSNMKSILEKGLLKMSRNHVHMSKDFDTAIVVAKRFKQPFHIITLKIPAGTKGLFKSKNEVYLMEYVSSRYIAHWITDKLINNGI